MHAFTRSYSQGVEWINEYKSNLKPFRESFSMYLPQIYETVDMFHQYLGCNHPA